MQISFTISFTEFSRSRFFSAKMVDSQNNLKEARTVEEFKIALESEVVLEVKEKWFYQTGDNL